MPNKTESISTLPIPNLCLIQSNDYNSLHCQYTITSYRLQWKVREGGLHPPLQ